MESVALVDVTQKEIHANCAMSKRDKLSEPELPITQLKTYESPDTDRILGKLRLAGGKTLCSDVYKLANSVWNRKL